MVDELRVVLRPRRVAIVLTWVAATLIVVSVVMNVVKLVIDDTRIDWLVDIFRLNQEQNLPSFFSGMLFMAAAALMTLIWRVETSPRHIGWILMAGLFVFLAFDELFAVHELLIEPVRDTFDLSGVFYFAWVVVYAFVAVGAALVFWPVARSLEKPLQKWFAVSGVTYLSGVIGFEMLGSARYSGSDGDVIYGMLYTIEESLEMLGLILFIYALLLVVARRPVPVLLTVAERE